MRRVDKKAMREWNKKLVLSILHKKRRTTRSEIAQQSGLSLATITHITARLAKEDFLTHKGSSLSNGGRRADILEFNPKAGVLSVMIFEKNRVRIAILDLDGSLLKEEIFPFSSSHSWSALFTDCSLIAQQLSDSITRPSSRAMALCAIFEGVVDSKNRILLLSSHLGWKNIPAGTFLEETRNIPTFIESSTRAIARGEYALHALSGKKEMLCVNVSDGIGAVQISRGAIAYGGHYLAGEIGHSIVAPKGKRCLCGRRGCLETVASGIALAKSSELLNLSPSSSSDTLSRRKAVSLLFEAAEKKNPYAKRKVRASATYLGRHLAHIAEAVDPEVIILTGYVFEEDPGIFFTEVKKALHALLFVPSLRKISILPGIPCSQSIIEGAAAIATSHLFSFSYDMPPNPVTSYTQEKL
ncbi:MAG: ROK family transcriptional regulator [Candidatus Ratteibacteria bacterium]|jgi:N-acetylglucosamine repressor